MRHPLLSLALALPLAGCGGTVVFEEDGGDGGAPQASTITVGSVGVGTSGTGTSGSGSSSGVGATGSSGGVTSSSGGATSSSGGATGSSSGNASSSSGSGPCETHDDCTGNLCIGGVCVPRCAAGQCDACTAGTVCEECATSSCPDCDDCVAACVPTPEGRCDDDDPCPGADQVCLFPYGWCAPSCESGECADPNMVCSECATGSCCGCENCVSACFPVDG